VITGQPAADRDAAYAPGRIGGQRAHWCKGRVAELIGRRRGDRRRASPNRSSTPVVSLRPSRACAAPGRLSHKPLRNPVHKLVGGITPVDRRNFCLKLGQHLQIRPGRSVTSHRHRNSEFLAALCNSLPGVPSDLTPGPGSSATDELRASNGRWANCCIRAGAVMPAAVARLLPADTSGHDVVAY